MTSARRIILGYNGATFPKGPVLARKAASLNMILALLAIWLDPGASKA